MTTTHIVIIRTITSVDPTIGFDANWDGKSYANRDEALNEGFNLCGCDDFNIGRVEDGRLVWFGWMDHEIPTDRVGVAHQIGLTA